MDVLGLGFLQISDWFLFFITIIFILYLYLTWEFKFFEKRGIPGPKPVPFFGNLHIVLSKGMTNLLLDNARKYGKLYGMFEGPRPALVCSDPEFLKHIFIKDHSNFMDRNMVAATGKLPDKMLPLVSGEHWKILRSTMSPTFSVGKLKLMIEHLNKCAKNLVDNLAQEAESGEHFECREYTGAFSMDAIASAAFGLELDSKKDENNEFVQMAKKGLDFALLRPFAIVSIFLPFLKPITRVLNIDFTPKDTHDFFAEVTNRAIQARKDSNEKRVDFLQLMINAHNEKKEDDTEHDQEFYDQHGGTKKRGLTKDEVLAQSIVFFMAGYETTATALAFLMYLLALNPDMQEKLHEEIIDVVGDQEVDYNLLCEMNLLDMCVQESLRMYSPAVRTSRVCNRATTVNGIDIPKGLSIIVPIHAIHHDPKIWPEPEKFNPYRFAKEEKVKHTPYDWMPFGSGPRNCIAMRLALTEVKVGIAHIVKNYKLIRGYKTESPLPLNKSGILKAQNGIWIQIEKR